MKAKQYLEQIPKINFLIEELLIEKKNWQDENGKEYGITTSYGESVIINGVLHNMEKIGGRNTSSQVESMAIKNSEVEIEYNRQIKILRDEKDKIINTMRQIKPEPFKLLYKYYVQGHTLKEAAYALGKTESWANSMHGRALQAVQKILDERDEKEMQRK